MLSEKQIEARRRLAALYKPKNDAIIAMFKENHSYTITGQEFGVTREWVRQVVRKYGDEEALEIADGMRQVYYAQCSICLRPYETRKTPTVHKGFASSGKCKTCLQYVRHGKGERQRLILPRGNCPQCGVRYAIRKKGSSSMSRKIHNMCYRCFAKTMTYKEKQKISRNKYLEARRAKYRIYIQKLLARDPDYFKRNQRKFLKNHPEHNKLHYQKHREEILMRSRIYYASHKAEINEKRKQYYRERKNQLTKPPIHSNIG